MDIKRVTENGTEITEDEYQSIRKAVVKDTLKTVLAVVGVGALVVVGRAWLATTKSTEENQIN